MNKILKGSIILSAGNLSVRVLGHIYRILMGKMLLPYEFGLLNLALPFQYMIFIISSSGIAPSVARFVAKERKEERNKIISSSLFYFFLTGMALAIALIILSPSIGKHIFHAQEVVILLKISAIAIPIGFVISSSTGTFQGFKKFEYMAYTLVSLQMARIIIAFLLVSSLREIGAILGSTLGFLAILPIVLIFVKKLKVEVCPPNFETFKEIFLFSLPVSTTAFATFILTYIDVLLLGYFLSPDEVGIYSAASPTSRLILAFTSAIYATLLPSISELHAKKRREEIMRSLTYAYKLCIAVLLPTLTLAIVFAPWIILLLFNESYMQATQPFRILAIGSAFLGIFMVNSGVFQGIGMPQIPMKILSLAAALDFVLNLILIPKFGIIGSAIATSSSLSFAGIFSTIILRSKI